MMVTFVSQCEKKSLNKTRRVLDAFANRIGSRTWQTVITNEGLNAVKKLLRKTASKNTAVSCHWIRSRSRSEFIWVVGNKDKFNAEGVVPVNYTNQLDALKMDEIMVDIKTYYANTNKQPLDQHLFAVGYVASELMKKITTDTALPTESFIAGCWHDMGKIEPKFQKELLNGFKKGISWNTNPRHNEISAMLYFSLSCEISVNGNRVEHAIYWHHAKPIRKKDIEHLIWIYDKVAKDYKNIVTATGEIIKSINLISKDYFDGNELILAAINFSKFSDLEDALEKRLIPEYKSYSVRGNISDYSKRIANNAKNNLIRTVITTADQLISNLTCDELIEHILDKSLNKIVDNALLKESRLKQYIKSSLDWFNNKYPSSERNLTQSKKAKELADEEVEIGVLRGAAGCGKTKIALEWAFNTNAKKIFWICPRVQVCQGLYNDLSQHNYLPDAAIEICTGEIKNITQSGSELYKENTPTNKIFSGDVVITTIDQIINSITTHKNITTLLAFLNAHVVFDEFHEYIHMPGFNLLFAELVGCKKLQQTNESLPNTLLVSATPNPIYMEKLLKIHKHDISIMPSFNKSKFQLKFVKYDDKDESQNNPFYSPQSKNTFVISNTAITAQKSFIDNQLKENSILLHANYKKGDRETLFTKVFDSFKQYGSKKYDLLRSGPIIQASLNITCDYMVSEMIHAENTLQRLGRLDRFGENSAINIFTIAITDKVISGKSHLNHFLVNKLFCLQSTKTWYEFLQAEDIENRVMSINDIYQLYGKFYNTPEHSEKVEQDLTSAINEGIHKLAVFLTPPLEYRNNSKKKDLVKIKKNSLRGNSRFVQMAQCKVIDRKTPEILNEYAFECGMDKNDVMTWDMARIEGILFTQKDSEKDLLAFMAQKHHQILKYKTDSKVINKNDSTYKKEALNPETPIFVSYTPEDLKLLGPSTKAKPNAIYYVIGKNQAIGALSLTDLKPKGK